VVNDLANWCAKSIKIDTLCIFLLQAATDDKTAPKASKKKEKKSKGAGEVKKAEGKSVTAVANSKPQRKVPKGKIVEGTAVVKKSKKSRQGK
jgi:hypothetical protein